MNQENIEPVNTSRLYKFWREWRGFVAFVAVMLVFRSAVADWNQVPSGSMQPSILVGDRVVVDKLAYDLRVPFTLFRVARWSDPSRGDVVTFPSPADERLFIKRVIGVPGDVVELRRNELIVNGIHATYRPLTAEEIARVPLADKAGYYFLHEDILGTSHVIMLAIHPRSLAEQTFAPVRVPEGNYLMLGDNRDNSGDYRVINWVSRERILGRAHAIAFSYDRDNYFAPRLDRFFEPLE
jgi:signal peptidase I